MSRVLSRGCRGNDDQEQAQSLSPAEPCPAAAMFLGCEAHHPSYKTFLIDRSSLPSSTLSFPLRCAGTAFLFDRHNGLRCAITFHFARQALPGRRQTSIPARTHSFDNKYHFFCQRRQLLPPPWLQTGCVHSIQNKRFFAHTMPLLIELS